VCQRVQPVAALENCVRATFKSEGKGRSVDTSHDPPASPKRTRSTFKNYPHKPAPTTPRAHTADCHSRCRPPRAVGHHHRIWGSVRTTHARTSPATPAARRGITGVVGMCLAESLRGLGGVYPDTAKVASHARAVGT
jgi:hypothetical protein